MGDRLDPARLVDVSLSIRPMNAPHALAAKRGERKLVCRVDGDGTVADLRAILVQDIAIGVNDVFIVDGRVVGRSSESATKWRSGLKNENVITPQTLILLSFPEEERTTPPSALATAGIIDDLNRITYPEGIMGPQEGLNIKAERGRFRYDRKFLLQFTAVCKDIPDNISPLELLNLKPRGNVFMSWPDRRGSGRRHPTSHLSASTSRTPQVSSGGPSADKKSASLTKGPAQIAGQDIGDLLKELTEERFNSVSDQIIAWVNKPENGTDTHIFGQVVQLVFQRATYGTASSEICARLCRKMTEAISLEIRDNKDTNGRPISGGQLFRKYLLGHCRDCFEYTLASRRMVKAGLNRSEDQIADTIPTDHKAFRDTPDAIRQDLGVIRFASELFKVQIINGRIMHDKYVKTLLGDMTTPTEETVLWISQDSPE